MEAKGEEGGEQQVEEGEEGLAQGFGLLGLKKAVVRVGQCLAVVPDGLGKGRKKVSE